MIQLNRQAVIETLFQTRSKLETAQAFQISRKTLGLRLKAWGVEVDFSLPPLEVPATSYQVGQALSWVPLKARQRCYGHPIAWAPVLVQVLGKRDKNGSYWVEVTCKDARRRLVKTRYTVHENALKEVNE